MPQVGPGDGELRVVVVGSEGHGKSTVANALLGTEKFAAGAKTTTADVGETSKAGMTIKVVDTPDISKNDMKKKDKEEEVSKWKEMVAPGASIFLLAIKGDAPYTEEDFIAYRQVRRFWGGRGSTKGRLVVAFTHCDGQDVNEVGDRMEEESPKWIGKIFKDSGGRFIVFKGKSSGNFLEEVMMDDDDDEEEEEEEESKRKGSGGKGRKGSGKGRKGSGKGRRGSGDSGGSGKGRKGSGKGRRGSGHGKGHFKAKGGRGRRKGHGHGHSHRQQGGLCGILCCICNLICK